MTTRTDSAPPPPRAATLGWFWVNTQVYEEWEKKIPLLASALEKNVANVETQAQSINAFYSHESSGVDSFSLFYTPVSSSSPLRPSDYWVLEQCFPFASAQNERNRNGRRCEPAGNYLKPVFLRMALGPYLHQTAAKNTHMKPYLIRVYNGFTEVFTTITGEPFHNGDGQAPP